MAELAVNTMIKLVVGIFILVIVVSGVTFGFTKYIKPYFEGFLPDDSDEGLDESFVAELLKPENYVAGIEVEKGKSYVEGSDKKYYIRGRIIEMNKGFWRLNPNVAKIDKISRLVVVEDEYANDKFLKTIDRSYLINGAFRKIQ